MIRFRIFLDDETARLLEQAALEEGISRSTWTRHAIQSALLARFPGAVLPPPGNGGGEEEEEPDEGGWGG